MRLHTPRLLGLKMLAATWAFAFTFFSLTASGSGADAPAALQIPKGHTVVDDSHSPDQRFAITAFDNESEDPPTGPSPNMLIELQNQRVITALVGRPAMTHINNGGIQPARWSPDGSLVLWEVDGKWFRSALVLVKLDAGKLAWQRDVKKLLEQEILTRTRKAEPQIYARVKKEHVDWGAAYPDGFAVAVEASDPIAFPLRVKATLASETKFESILNSHIEGEINAKGELKITKFSLGPAPER